MCKDAVAPPSFKFGCKDTSFYPKRDENYYEYVKKNEGIIVFYGVGNITKKYYKRDLWS